MRSKFLRFIWLLLIVGVVVEAIYVRSKVPKAPRGIAAIPKNADAGTMMFHLAEQAVMDSKVYWNLHMDYSPASVERAEEALDLMCQSPKFEKMTDKDIRAEALIFGAYVGEVIRRQYGGTWSENHKQVGPGSYPLHWNAKDSFPFVWCYKQLKNGPEDNVWHKYQYFVSKSLDSNIQIEETKVDFSK